MPTNPIIMPPKNLRTILLLLAWESIAHGLKTGKPLRIDPNDYPEELRRRQGSFVKLRRGPHLRGCVGSIEPIRPLAEDVAENAFAAAFCDKHFPALSDDELTDIKIEIMLVSALEEMTCASQLDLLSQLRPQIDGIVLREGSHHANLLPSTWDGFHSPLAFVNHLMQLAGLPLSYWSKNIKIYRYTTENFSESTS